MGAFVGVFILSWIWTPVDRFLKIYFNDVPPTIQLLRLIGASGSGMWNYVVWHWIELRRRGQPMPEWAHNLYGKDSIDLIYEGSEGARRRRIAGGASVRDDSSSRIANNTRLPESIFL